jgi:hypothetical protein
MKKLTLLFITTTLIFGLTTNAQIKKGSVFLGGDISFTTEKGASSNNIDYKTSGIYLLPVYGKAVKENLIIGTDILYYFQNSDVSLDFNDLKQWIYGIGFFARGYQQLAKTKLSLFIQGHIGTEYDKTKQAFNTIDKIEKNTFSINLSVYPGISYSLNHKLQLETGFSNLFGLRYFNRKGTSGTVNPVSSDASGFSLYASAENVTRFYLGFRLLILKK